MTQPLARLLLSFEAILAGFCGFSSASAASGEEPKDKVFVGYLFGEPREIHFKLYTHICHAFVVADAEGKIRTSRTVPSRELAVKAHQAGCKMILSLGGWGWDSQFAAIVAKPEAEDRYIQSVLALVDASDYDGIDLDWEYPDTEREIIGFERMARRLRKELNAMGTRKGRPKVLTMAASANPGTLKWLGKDFLLETMDWLNVMTYDFAGAWTDYAGHHSPLHASSKQPTGHPRSTELTMKYLLEERGLPPDRLAVGIPLYGRGFPVSEPYASTKNARKTAIPRGNYSNLHRLEREQDWVRKWDGETKNPWLISPDHSIVIGYDDAESVALKTEWAMQKGFRGVFFWQIAADRLPDGTNPLQEAARRKWAERVRKGR
jgi:chitinase